MSLYGYNTFTTTTSSNTNWYYEMNNTSIQSSQDNLLYWQSRRQEITADINFKPDYAYKLDENGYPLEHHPPTNAIEMLIEPDMSPIIWLNWRVGELADPDSYPF